MKIPCTCSIELVAIMNVFWFGERNHTLALAVSNLVLVLHKPIWYITVFKLIRFSWNHSGFVKSFSHEGHLSACHSLGIKTDAQSATALKLVPYTGSNYIGHHTRTRDTDTRINHPWLTFMCSSLSSVVKCVEPWNFIHASISCVYMQVYTDSPEHKNIMLHYKIAHPY